MYHSLTTRKKMTENFFESPHVVERPNIEKQQNVPMLYKQNRRQVTASFLVAAGMWGAFFGLLKFEIIRDFVQFFALFFGNISAKSMEQAKHSYGRVFGVAAVDYHMVDNQVNPYSVMEALLTLSIVLGILMCCCSTQALGAGPTWVMGGNHDRYSFGKTVCFMTCMVTISTFYLPVMRGLLEMVVCGPSFTRALVQENFFNSEEVIGDLNVNDLNETESSEPNQCLLLAEALNNGVSDADIIDRTYTEQFQNQTLVVDFGDCSCHEWSEAPAPFFLVVILLCWLICCPICYQNLIGDAKPYGSEEDKNGRYNEEGILVEYTEDQYIADLRSGAEQLRNPAHFLYSGYRPDWAYHKIVMMLAKAFLVGAVIIPYDKPVDQSIACLFVFLSLGGLLYFSPHFIDASDSAVYMLGLVSTIIVLFFVAISASVDSSSVDEAVSSIVIATATIYLASVTAVTLWDVRVVRGWMKTIMGRLQFSDATKKIEGSARSIIPQWDLAAEIKRRVWQPFWEAVLLEEGRIYAERVMEMERESTQWGHQKILEHWQNSTDPENVTLRNYLMETLEGVDVYYNETSFSHDMEVAAENQQARKRDVTKSDSVPSPPVKGLLSTIAGAIFGSSDKSRSVPRQYRKQDVDGGSGRTRQRDIVSTYFGKLSIKWYPFHAIFTYDDTGEQKHIWEDKTHELLQINESPEIQRRRKIRQQLRTLHGKTITFYYEKWRTFKNIPDGKQTWNERTTYHHRDDLGRTWSTHQDRRRSRQLYSDVRVLLRFSKGRLSVNTKGGQAIKDGSYDTSPGFRVVLNLIDGAGNGTKPRTGKNYSVKDQEAQLTFADLEIDNQYTDCPSLRQILYNRPNASIWERELPSLHAQMNEFRQGLIQTRCQDESILSSAFWMLIYDNDTATAEEINAYFKYFEVRSKIKSVPDRHNLGLQYVLNKMHWINEHPCAALWYTFFDDLWEANNEVSKVKAQNAILDPKEEDSIAFRPMPRNELEQELTTTGLVQSRWWLNTDTLDLLYEVLHETDREYKQFIDESVEQQADQPAAVDDNKRLSMIVKKYTPYVRAAYEFRRRRLRTRRVHEILQRMVCNHVQNLANYGFGKFAVSTVEGDNPNPTARHAQEATAHQTKNAKQGQVVPV
eukprot:gb/GECG01001886.1/.p1 GENE.gb/GECG01001886.1/~~gb/GECG01001886.1/.p1  ORF type:complete len:1135 (+),score=119.37 gb/GECG01001886.1/:1-3405(+)